MNEPWSLPSLYVPEKTMTHGDRKIKVTGTWIEKDAMQFAKKSVGSLKDAVDIKVSFFRYIYH